ncbi:thioesterase family protein [Heyndrickxia acidicola]|uniref:Thioesterase n=1 Tax=Heyndrickxia acidicola TaxID=209389 RepID=A0ABU6ME76_9BACI|nr:thioesterase [Heyndrickxia acidicola]MED1202975.1 thioesterase [Heyndrickxia acidicola]
MKSGMEIGRTSNITFTVTPEMFAQFEGEIVHEAYSTVSMVYHMEWASRKIILPFLEEDEEGIGGAVEVKHIAPTGPGTIVNIKATLTKVKENVIITETEATNEKGLIGKGRVKQVVLKKADIHRKLMESGIKN